MQQYLGVRRQLLELEYNDRVARAEIEIHEGEVEKRRIQLKKHDLSPWERRAIQGHLHLADAHIDGKQARIEHWSIETRMWRATLNGNEATTAWAVRTFRSVKKWLTTW